MEKYYTRLQQTELFKDFDMAHLDRIFHTIQAKIFNYEKTKNLFIKKEIFDSLYILLKGKIKAETMGLNDKIIRIGEFRSPEIIAPFFLFGTYSFFPFNIIALEDIQILSIPKKDLVHLLQEDHQVLENYLHLTSNKFIFLSNKMEFLHFNTISKKLAYYLLNLPSNNIGEVTLPLSIVELSEYFGVERPSLSKVIGLFVKEKIISQKSRRIIQIMDRRSLEEKSKS